MNIVFLDMDETLISSEKFYTLRSNGNYVHFEQGIKIRIESTYDNVEIYYVMLRKGAKEFISELRKRYKVCILTAATLDYAFSINREWDLGFKPDEIFTREMMDYIPDDFRDVKSILFDNLPESQLNEKTRWLKMFGKYKIINVEWYYGDNDDEAKWTPEIIQNYLKLVENYFNET